MPVVRHRGLASLALLVLLVPFATAPVHAGREKGCLPTVQPIRNARIVVAYDITFRYSAKDEGGAREDLITGVTDELNALGRSDGNRFAIQDGEAASLWIILSVTSDSNENLMLNGRMAGWGWNVISNVSSGPNPYFSPNKMLAATAKDIYHWLHNGWHDATRGCGDER